MKLLLGEQYLFRHVQFCIPTILKQYNVPDIFALSNNQFDSLYSLKGNQSDLIEICDHVFIFSALRKSDSFHDELFKESTELKIWSQLLVRKNCELCNKVFSEAAFTFKVNDMNYATFLCFDCYQNYCQSDHVNMDSLFNQKVFKYRYHLNSKFHGGAVMHRSRRR